MNGENFMERLLRLCFGVLLVLGTAGKAAADCFPTDQPLPDGCYRLASGKCSLGTPGTFSSVVTNTDGTIGANFSGEQDLRPIGFACATCSSPPSTPLPTPSVN